MSAFPLSNVTLPHKGSVIALRYRSLLRSLLIVCGVVVGTCAFSQPLLNYDFEDQSIVGWGINSTNSSPADLYLSVIDDPLREGNKVMKIDDSHATLNGVTTKFSDVSSGSYRLSLDILFSSTGGVAETPVYFVDRRVQLTNSAVSALATYTRFWNYQSGQNQERRTYGYNGGTSVREQDFTFNEWYRVVQEVNLDNKTWSWSLYNITTGVSVSQSEEYAFYGAPASLGALGLWRADSRGGVILVDNVSVIAVPEPSAAVAFGVASLMLFARRRLTASR